VVLVGWMLVIAASGCRTPPTPEIKRLVIENVTVIPMTGVGDERIATVVIEDGKIVSMVGPDGEDARHNVRRIDGSGKFLLPSFVDTHVHLDDVGDLSVLLAHGVGAVRNMEGQPYHLYVRDLVDDGTLIGPRFKTCGPYTNLPTIQSVADAENAVREQHDAGYDCIKIHGELSVESLEALGRTASEFGMPVVGHAPRNLDLQASLSVGAIREISHAEEYLYTWYAHHNNDGWERDAATATRQAGVEVAPALAMYRSILRQVADLDAELSGIPLELAGPFSRRAFRPSNNQYKRKFNPEDATWMGEYLGRQQALVTALRDEGVTLLLGTDANATGSIPGHAVHEELALLVASGLTPYEALEVGTRNGWDSVVGRGFAGRVREGLAAELVLLDANPLVDIQNSRKITGVVSSGRWFDRAALDALLREQIDRYVTDQPFVDRLWDNDIGDAMEWYGQMREEDPSVQVARETMACQAMRSVRDGAPEAAVEMLDILVSEYPEDPLGTRLLEDLNERGAAE